MMGWVVGDFIEEISIGLVITTSRLLIECAYGRVGR